jgi:CO dehydrogenase nickel-insertion accessory protein CooC1
VGNRFDEAFSPLFQKAAEAQGLIFLGAIPPDPDVLRYSVEGVSLLKLPLENPAVKKMGELMGKMGLF